MHSRPSPQILPHMGKDLRFLPLKHMAILDYMGKDKESSFLPPEMQSYPSPHRKESCFSPQSASFPSFSPKYTTLPLKSSLIYKEGFFPIQNAKPLKILPYKIFFLYILIFHIIFCLSEFSFFFFFIISFDFFFPQKLEFFPKVEKLFPSVWGE